MLHRSPLLRLVIVTFRNNIRRRLFGCFYYINDGATMVLLE
jgi:hypothetical protein